MHQDYEIPNGKFSFFSPSKFTTPESGLRGHIDSGEWVEERAGRVIQSSDYRIL